MTTSRSSGASNVFPRVERIDHIPAVGRPARDPPRVHESHRSVDCAVEEVRRDEVRATRDTFGEFWATCHAISDTAAAGSSF
jgi:hypothetical protein